MKKIIIVTAFLFCFLASNAQSYTYIGQRYEWLAGVFRALGVPAGAGPAAFQTGQRQWAGAIFYDSVGVDSGLYVWSGLAWRQVDQPSAVNIYTSDGTITGNRIVNANDKSLTFNNLFGTTFNLNSVSSDNPFSIINTGATNTSSFTTTRDYLLLRAQVNASTALREVVIDNDSVRVGYYDGVNPEKYITFPPSGQGYVALSVNGNVADAAGNITISSGSGTVNSGTINTLAYYPATGTTVDDLPAITANRALVSDANGLPVASATTATELGFISGLTSNAQTQFNGKANTALSNLASVAINTSLISDANNTDDLGSTSLAFRDIYSYTHKLKGSTSGELTLVASAVAGAATITFPAATGTVALLGGTNTWTGVSNTFNNLIYPLGGISTDLNSLVANLGVYSGGSISGNITDSRHLFEGAGSIQARITFAGNINTVLGANNSFANIIMAQNPITEAASGNHALIAGPVLKPPAITAGAATVSNTATLYISGAPSATVSDQQAARSHRAGLQWHSTLTPRDPRR